MAEDAASEQDREPRTERGRRTQRALLDSAAAEFGERGFHEASITSITARAEVALGTFYTYFESKEALFTALVRDMSRQVRQHIAQHIGEAPDRLEAERQGIRAYIEFVRANPNLYRIIEESRFVAEDAYRDHYYGFAEAYERGLKAARARGEISEGPDDIRAWALIGVSVFLGWRYGVMDTSMDADALADAAGDFIAKGLSR
jgi:AcrR family transcriptional regulator